MAKFKLNVREELRRNIEIVVEAESAEAAEEAYFDGETDPISVTEGPASVEGNELIDIEEV